MIFLIKDFMLFQSLRDPLPAIFSSAALGCITTSLDFHSFEVALIDHHPYLLVHRDRSSRFERWLQGDYFAHILLIHTVVGLLVATSTHRSYLFYPSNAFTLRVECSSDLFALSDLG